MLLFYFFATLAEEISFYYFTQVLQVLLLVDYVCFRPSHLKRNYYKFTKAMYLFFRV